MSHLFCFMPRAQPFYTDIVRPWILDPSLRNMLMLHHEDCQPKECEHDDLIGLAIETMDAAAISDPKKLQRNLTLRFAIEPAEFALWGMFDADWRKNHRPALIGGIGAYLCLVSVLSGNPHFQTSQTALLALITATEELYPERLADLGGFITWCLEASDTTDCDICDADSTVILMYLLGSMSAALNHEMKVLLTKAAKRKDYLWSDKRSHHTWFGENSDPTLPRLTSAFENYTKILDGMKLPDFEDLF